ncbi:MAG: DUF6691 family protein [Xanthobacteraceae bacterium]
MRILSAFLCGLIFGLGLVISGMTDTAKVLGFLDVLAIPKGKWDPTLLIVMAAALAVSMPGFVLAGRRSRPLLAEAAAWPTRKDIDRPLLAGAALFGAGWGLVGLCPGPAIANLATLSPAVLLFVAAMTAGMAAHDIRRRGIARREAAVGADR